MSMKIIRAVLFGIASAVFIGACVGVYLFWRFGLPEYKEIANERGPKSKVEAPPRPTLVPASALWAGGADGGSFIECDVDEKHNVNRCLVYNDSTGDLNDGGFFQLSSLHRAARPNELKFEGADGERIFLADGKSLVHVEPIRPEQIPSTSVFANGLFIACDDLASAKTGCSIYRPDGTLYFQGNFSFEGEPLTEHGDRHYKFFDLSGRTIYLEGGGKLLSK
jgi:hypothetical protein